MLDATAGSDAGIDVVSSEYATVAAEQTALERLSEVVADQIVARLGLFAARTAPRPATAPMKAARGSIGRALDQPDPAIRLYLFHGPDEGQSRALGERLLKALGAEPLPASMPARSARTRRCSPTRPGR